MFNRYYSVAILGLLATTTTNPDCSLESVQFPTEPVCSELSPDVQASNGWRNVAASQTAEGELFFRYKARPTVAGQNGLLAIAPQPVDTFSDAAILVRFAGDGSVDARNGSIYDSELVFPYEAGVWYDIAVSADLKSQTYTVDIGRCGEPLSRLITKAAFRFDAPDSTQLTHWAVWSSQSATLDVATASWGATGSCQPTTCQSLGRECGSASNGCGGTLSCGACASGESCSSGTCVAASTPSPGGNWWDGVAKPNASNTGPNCSAAHCPSAALRDLGSCPTISTNGATLENFECDGMLRLEASNVTLRNFRIDAAGSNQGIFIAENAGVTGNLFEYGEIFSRDGETSECLRGRGFTGRYLHVHDCNDTQKVGGADQGPLVIEHSYYHNVTGGHGDAFQVWEASDSAMTVRYSSIECGNTACLITTSTVGGVITFENNWIYGGGAYYPFYCGWDPGDVGPSAVFVRDNLFDRNYRGALATDIEDCVWTGNLFMDTLTPANGDTD